MHHLAQLGRRCVFAVVGGLDMASREARETIRVFQSRVVRDQKRAGLPQFWLCVLETEGGLHANLVFVSTVTVERRLLASTFGENPKIRRVTDFDGLVDYLAKERTSQAEYALGHRLGRRRRASHQLEGGGDRVKLSRALRAEAEAAGLVEPWQRTKAKVLVPRACARPGSGSRASRLAREGPEARPVQIAPAPPASALVVETIPEPIRSTLMQLDLFDDLPRVERLSAERLRAIRVEHGLSQRGLGARIGFSSSGSVANFERRHDRISAPRQRLILHMLETGRLAA